MSGRRPSGTSRPSLGRSGSCPLFPSFPRENPGALKGTELRWQRDPKPQTLADSLLLLEISAFGGHRKPQKTADFCRKPKIVAENRRKPQIGLRHLRSVTFSSALEKTRFKKYIWENAWKSQTSFYQTSVTSLPSEDHPSVLGKQQGKHPRKQGSSRDWALQESLGLCVLGISCFFATTETKWQKLLPGHQLGVQGPVINAPAFLP